MEKVKFNSIMRNAYDRYLDSWNYSLWDVYNSWSHAKQEAWNYCEKLCKEYEGHSLRIIGACSTHFSAGFTYRDNENKEHFVFITKDHDRDAIIDEAIEEGN